jgi:putative polyhydroxyalkanoate system protein
MRETISVSIPHHLGKDEALRRIRDGVTDARTKFASVLTVQQADWSGDTLSFQVSAVAQQVGGTIEVLDNSVKLDVELPWILAKLAKVIAPAIQKEGTLLLDKK